MTSTKKSERQDHEVAAEFRRRILGKDRVRYCEAKINGEHCFTVYPSADGSGEIVSRTRIGRWRENPYCDKHTHVSGAKGYEGACRETAARGGKKGWVTRKTSGKGLITVPSLRYWREFYGISRPTLSKDAGIHVDTIRHIERDPSGPGEERRHCSEEAAKKLVRAMNTLTKGRRRRTFKLKDLQLDPAAARESDLPETSGSDSGEAA